MRLHKGIGSNLEPKPGTESPDVVNNLSFLKINSFIDYLDLNIFNASLIRSSILVILELTLESASLA